MRIVNDKIEKNDEVVPRRMKQKLIWNSSKNGTFVMNNRKTVDLILTQMQSYTFENHSGKPQCELFEDLSNIGSF